MSINKQVPDLFIHFKGDISSIELPTKFNFPFYYDPHPLAIIACEEIQKTYLENHQWEHNFGLEKEEKGLVIGKMFGVLVVKTQANEIGYLCAFSGKLANQNHHFPFVPPVYDLLDHQGFFLEEELRINEYTKEIEDFENNIVFTELQQELITLKKSNDISLENFKQFIKVNKKRRQNERGIQKDHLSPVEYEQFCLQLSQESISEQYQLKELKSKQKQNVLALENRILPFKERLESLKNNRAQESNLLQQRIFEQYTFLNSIGNTKSLQDIFSQTVLLKPPAGAGECAAPKLLQYAYLNKLTPIVMAEFWWGQAPASEIRQHKQYYPACKGKCEPILGHMLTGIEVEENPMLKNPAENRGFEIHYEDEAILIVNKPHEFLSVPGKNISDSIQTRIAALYPEATGPLLVHRLDMSTSGILLVAKTKEAHQYLQAQFIKRKVEKYYEALIEHAPVLREGEINLPLRLDIEDRPKQIVCYDHGKEAKTIWTVLERRENTCLIKLRPITGRTHQLRVHCAHKDGLNSPIIGDDLYGTKKDRLYLHAAFLKFRHPISKEMISFYIPSNF